MLTVLLTLAIAHADRPITLPLPQRPANIPHATCSFTCNRDSNLDNLNTPCISSNSKSNYQLWFEHGEEWMSSCSSTQKFTLKAKEKPRESCCSYSSMSGSTSLPNRDLMHLNYYPWHAFRDRFTWHGMPVSEVVEYTVRNTPSRQAPYFVAELDALPHIKVQATTKEELERKVLERFQSYIEGLADLELNAFPIPKVEPTPTYWPFIAWPPNRLPPTYQHHDGVIAGVWFVF